MLFRKALVRIRREYHSDKKRLFLYSALALALISAIGAAVDAFVPFSGLWNVLRSFILAPTAVAMFVLGYAISLHMHYTRAKADPEWIPYRLRLSPMWRRRISAIIAAFAFVFVYANGYRIGYTFVSSIFVAVVIALFAFMRTTRDEARREEFDIPDTRDTRYEAHRQRIAAERIAAQATREKKKKKKVESDSE